MRIKPILFNTEMVRAILDGRKTVTRRKIGTDIINFCDMDFDGKLLDYQNADGDFINPAELCRYQPGDIMYVRETWRVNAAFYDNSEGSVIFDYKAESSSYQHDMLMQIKYKGISPNRKVHVSKETAEKYAGKISFDGKWHPSIHMPKEAARIWLKVTDVRAERLQDINSTGCLQEGIESEYPYVLNGEEKRFAFSQLWDSTIKKSDLDRYDWAANPWVWVIEFERCEKPENV